MIPWGLGRNRKVDPRYQVFVSSTFADLQEERQAVMQALLSLNHFPAGMELFPASDEDQWSLIKGVIDDSDYYVLVIGGRYGSRDSSGVSYTEKEFEYAVSQSIPVLAFVHDKTDDIPSGKTDKNDGLREQLQKFVERVKNSGRHIKFWNGADDLKAKVILAIAAETKRNPREGWIRGDKSVDLSVVEALRQEIDKLNNELQLSRHAPPSGAERYEGGKSTFNAGLTFYLGTTRYTGTVSVTWDDIFFEVGPVLMDEGTELQMMKRLGDELWRYDTDRLKQYNVFSIQEDTFQTIKVQLVALGLIQKSTKKHVPSDRAKYWSLTPFGETKLMTLRAILKGEGTNHLSAGNGSSGAQSNTERPASDLI